MTIVPMQELAVPLKLPFRMNISARWIRIWCVQNRYRSANLFRRIKNVTGRKLPCNS